MGRIRNLLIGLRLIRRKPVKRVAREDDLLQEVIDYIHIHTERTHIVAVSSMKSAEIILRHFEHRTNDRIKVFHYMRLCSGMVFRESNLSLSCAFTVSDEMVFRQLTSRLKAEDGRYRVALDPSVTLHDYDRAKPRG